MHGKAHHISCAYHIGTCRGPAEQDVVDDMDHGNGRAIMRAMWQAKMHNRAIYVVRYYGGIQDAIRLQLCGSPDANVNAANIIGS